jgi:predicted esterase YcpF (UPF0227 family)
MKSLTIECAGYSVDADWYEGENTNEILLSLFGWPNASRKTSVNMLANIVEKTGVSALVFDYSGIGNSMFDRDKTRPAQHFLEVICVFDWLRATYLNAKITIMGTSYGGYLATQLIKYRTFDKLILRVPAIYPPEDFYTLNGVINSDEGWASKAAFRKDPDALAKHPLLTRAAANFKGKTLVVVHEHDDSISKETTDAYIHAFKSEVYLAKDFPHSLKDVPREKIEQYQNVICDWLKK